MSERHRRKNGSWNSGYHPGWKGAKLPHVEGRAGEMLVSGEWLTRSQACEVLGCSGYELDCAVSDGAIERKLIGPRAGLYRVPEVA